MNQTEWMYLFGVPQDPEADIIVGLLESQGIPVAKRYPDAGQFLKTAYGLTSGVDIYVPKEYLADAKQLLESTSLELEDESLESREFDKSQESQKASALTVEKYSSSLTPWIIVLVILVLALALLISIYKYPNQ